MNSKKCLSINVGVISTVLSYDTRFLSRTAMKRVHLDAEDLALGHVMAQSKKNRENLIDHSYNRYYEQPELRGLVEHDSVDF